MTHVQIAGAVAPARPLPPARRSRSPWAPTAAGPYRLPKQVEGELVTALAGFRNREAAFALAHFLARFWSSPRRLLCAIPVDRRALAEHEALGLTEARVRGALATLVEIGFLARYEPEAGKRYQRTETGLQRRAILHRFGETYASAFTRANTRAQGARRAPAPTRRPVPRPAAPRAPTGNVVVPRPMPLPQVAQKQISSERGVIMGEQGRLPETGELKSALEAALDRWRVAIGG